MRQGGRTALPAAVCIAIVLAGAALWEDDGDPPRLVADVGGGAGIVYHDLAVGQPTTVTDLTVCVDRPGSVEVVAVESSEPFGGLTLDRFALVPLPLDAQKNQFDDAHQPLSSYGIDLSAPMIAHGTCPPADTGIGVGRLLYRLALQYTRPTGQTAGNHGIVIRYTTDGGEGSVYANWQILLCDPADLVTEDCQR